MCVCCGGDLGGKCCSVRVFFFFFFLNDVLLLAARMECGGEIAVWVGY